MAHNHYIGIDCLIDAAFRCQTCNRINWSVVQPTFNRFTFLKDQRNLKFLSTKGRSGISAENTLTGLETRFEEAINAASPDLYFVVTEQMAGWISSISKIGNWDIETGSPITPQGNKTGPQLFYEPLNCRLAGYPERLNCTGAAIDLEQGLFNGVPALSGWAHSHDGEVVRRPERLKQTSPWLIDEGFDAYMERRRAILIEKGLLTIPPQ